jgi:FkbM family methyltransferase
MLTSFDRCLLVHPDWLKRLRGLPLPPLVFAMPSASLEQSMRRGIDALQQNRPGDALREFAAAHREFTAAAGAPAGAFLFLQGIAFLLAGQTDRAAEYVAQSLALSPGEPRFNYLRGLLLLTAGNIAQAACHFQRAVDADPSLGQAWAALALIHSLAGHEPQAEGAARSALALGFELDGGLISLALMQATWRQGKPVEGPFTFSSLAERHPPRDVEATLPPIDPAQFTHPDHGLPVIFIYCDHAYCIEHALTLIWSIAESGSRCAVHLHVANPGRGLSGILEAVRHQVAPLPVFVSVESGMPHTYTAPTVYHSCVRFCRMNQLLRRNKAPVIMIDADSLVRRGLEDAPGLDAGADIGLCRMEHEPMWQEYAAGIFWARPTPAGLAFTARVSAFILDNILTGHGRWFLDQVALHACLDLGRESDEPPPAVVARLPPAQFLDLKHTAGSSLWVVTIDKAADDPYNSYKSHLKQKYGFDALTAEPKYGIEVVKSTWGTMFINRADKYIGASIRATGAWAMHEIELLRSLDLRGLTVVDAGANIGSHTLAFSRFVGPHGRVYAFEPQRLVYQLLAANLAANGITNVYSFQKGLASRPGTMRVAPPHEADNFGAVRLHAGAAAVMPGETAEVVTVDSLKLDACHLIKMDIEGMELDALAGAADTVRRCRPVLYLENHPGENRFKLIEFVESLGYRVIWHGRDSADPNILCLPQESPLRIVDKKM